MLRYNIILCLLLLMQQSNAQKLMKLPANIEQLAEPLQVKQKTGIGFLRYEFGPYRLLNSRKGWTSKSNTTTEQQDVLSRLLSNVKEVEQNIKQKRSFKLLRNETDTAIVNMATTTTLYYTQPKNNIFGRNEGPATYNRGKTDLITTILSADTSDWIFSTAQQETAGIVSISEEVVAVLTNGIREIELLPVNHYADGKKAMYVLGYVFQENGIPIAAVQFRGLPLMAHKQNFVWLPKNESKELQFVIAAVATVMLALSQEMAAPGG
ncbi:hypothetical protein [Lacibacter sediminis]|uniref:Uncharacterized protein n=1 Tax=Lacibacter sediminis TaxID=2760713 RepID=A0A7G5XGS0_9BACT|nr:hypothetical protein [Lacibacter sediminis]QNA44673.1 hypothetical protein H4075_00305 [Lacibacter sediminis]